MEFARLRGPSWSGVCDTGRKIRLAFCSLQAPLCRRPKARLGSFTVVSTFFEHRYLRVAPVDFFVFCWKFVFQRNISAGLCAFETNKPDSVSNLARYGFQMGFSEPTAISPANNPRKLGESGERNSFTQPHS